MTDDGWKKVLDSFTTEAGNTFVKERDADGAIRYRKNGQYAKPQAYAAAKQHADTEPTPTELDLETEEQRVEAAKEAPRTRERRAYVVKASFDGHTSGSHDGQSYSTDVEFDAVGVFENEPDDDKLRTMIQNGLLAAFSDSSEPHSIPDRLRDMILDNVYGVEVRETGVEPEAVTNTMGARLRIDPDNPAFFEGTNPGWQTDLERWL